MLALNLPFDQGALFAIFLLDVLHHIPDLDAFFKEAIHVLQSKAVVAMVEPANTLLVHKIFQSFGYNRFSLIRALSVLIASPPLFVGYCGQNSMMSLLPASFRYNRFEQKGAVDPFRRTVFQCS
jgi:hypothetical protein